MTNNGKRPMPFIQAVDEMSDRRRTILTFSDAQLVVIAGGLAAGEIQYRYALNSKALSTASKNEILRRLNLSERLRADIEEILSV